MAGVPVSSVQSHNMAPVMDATASPMIPKPVFNAPLALSPAPSIDSLDSSSSYSPASSYTSEGLTDMVADRAYGKFKFLSQIPNFCNL